MRRIPPLFILYIFLILQVGYFFFVSTRPYRIAPPGHTYTILGKNFYYPSMIRQSRDGSLGIRDTHTTRPTPTVYAQLFFVSLGKIAAVLRIDPVMMYQIARLTGAVVGALALYWFCRRFFSQALSVLATILALGIEPGPTIESLKTFSPDKLIPAWDVHILYERRFALPHHTWGETLGILLFGALFALLFHPPKTIKRQVLAIVGVSVLAFCATTTLPPYIVLFYAIALPIMFRWAWKHGSFRYYFSLILPPLCAIGIAAIFLKFEFSKGTPWDNWTATEKSWMTHSTVIFQYLQTLMPYYILSLVGIVGTLVRWKKMSSQLRFLMLVSAAWLVVPVLFIPLSGYSFFPFANFRLVDITGYVPAALLATLGVYHLTKLIPHSLARTGTVALFLVLMIIGSMVSTITYTKQIFAVQDQTWGTNYPTVTAWQGVLEMEKLPQGSNVMVREGYGEMLPAFGPVSSFIGGAHGFPDFLERRWVSDRFFAGQLTEQQAKETLEQEHITHVFWGPEERAITQTPSLYPSLLQPIYTNTDVTIFQVKK